MALDRQTIEKKDFPIVRRGYDVEAVDAHLRRLTEEVAELRRSGTRGHDSMALAASEQVQAIVGAAEQAAEKIQADAKREASEIRREARSEADAAREEATTQAREHVSKVSEATDAMLARIETLDRELGTTVDSLRSAGSRLSTGLQELDRSFGEVSRSVAPPAVARASAPVPLAADEPEDDFDEPVDDFDEPEDELDEPEDPSFEELEPYVEAESQAELPVAAAAEGDSGDLEGARIIALNMALNGTAREEVDRYLAENFELRDRATLIDEVYASVEG